MTREEKRKKAYKEMVQYAERVNASQYKGIAERFNQDYSPDYMSSWHTEDEINTYFDRLKDLNDRTSSLKNYIDMYGTDEQKATIGKLDASINHNNAFLGKRQEFIDTYGAFTDAGQYDRYVADFKATQETNKRARDNYEHNKKISETLQNNLDSLLAQRGAIQNKITAAKRSNDYTPQKKASYEKQLAEINILIDDKQKSKAGYDDQIALAELLQRNEDYAAIPEADDYLEYSTPQDGLFEYNPTKTSDRVVSSIFGNPMGIGTNFSEGRYAEMSDEEKGIYNYLVNKGQKDKADQYLLDLDNELVSRQAQDISDFIQKYSIGGVGAGHLASVVSVPMSLSAGFVDLSDTIEGKQGGLSNVTSAIRAGTSEDIGKWAGGIGKFGYNTLMSAADSLTAGAITYATGIPVGKTLFPVGEILLGTSAGMSSYNDVKTRGGDQEQAVSAGIAAGVFESLFEHFSLSTMSLFEPDDWIKGIGVGLKNIGKEAFVNASEEALTEAANILFDNYNMGELSNYALSVKAKMLHDGMSEEEAEKAAQKELLGQIGEAAISGGLMGIGFGGAGQIRGYRHNAALGKTILGNDETKMEYSQFVKEAERYYTKKNNTKALKEIQGIKEELGKNKNKYSTNFKERIGGLYDAYIKDSVADMKEEGAAVFEHTMKDPEKAYKEYTEKVKGYSINGVKYDVGNDTEITINGIEKGVPIITVNGRTDKANAFVFENEDLAAVVCYSAGVGDGESATRFLEGYKSSAEEHSGLSLTSYWAEFMDIQNKAYLGVNDETIKADKAYTEARYLSESAKLAALLNGQKLKAATDSKIKKISSETASIFKENKLREQSGNFDDSQIDYGNLTAQQKDFVTLAHIFSDVFGANVVLKQSKESERATADNGSYNRKTNTITLDINAGFGITENFNNQKAIKDLFIQTLSHESVHNLATVSPEAYIKLKDYVLQVYEKQGYDIEAVIKAKRKKRNGTALSRENAIEEIVAEACEDMLASSEKLRDFMKGFYEKDRKAAQKFGDTLIAFLKKIKSFFQELSKTHSKSTPAQIMAEAGIEIIDELRAIYEEGMMGLREANLQRNAVVEMNNTAETAQNEKSASDNAETMGQARRAIRLPNGTDILSQSYVDSVINSFGISEIGDYRQVQDKVFDTLQKEGFFNNADNRSRIDKNIGSNMVIEINKSGIEETFCEKNYRNMGRFKKLLKLATIRELPNAIQNGTLIIDNAVNMYDPQRETKYAYLLYDTNIDGNEITIKITIRKTKQKNKFWVHGYEAIKNVSDHSGGSQRSSNPDYNIADNGSIPQSAANVNPNSENFSENDPDTMSQLRKITPSPSEALETLFSTNPDFEGYADKKRELVKYHKILEDRKKLMGKIETIEKKITQLKAQRGQSGKYTGMYELEAQKAKAKADVAEYERRMFELEAGALKKVVDKEIKKAVVNISNKLKAKSKETADLIEINRNYVQQIEDLKKQKKEEVKDLRERQEKREVIERIEERARKLRKEFITNSKEHHIPDIFKDAVLDLSNALDLSSKRSLKGGEATQKDIKLSDALNKMNEVLEGKENGATSKELESFLNEAGITDIELREKFYVFAKRIDTATKNVQNNKEALQSADVKTLQELNKALREIIYCINQVNKMFSLSSTMRVKEFSEGFKTEAEKYALVKKRASTVSNNLDITHETPYYFFKRLGGTGKLLYDAWSKASGEYAMLINKVIEFTNALYTDKEVNNWSKTIHKIEAPNGTTIYMSDADIMSLWLLYQQEDGKRHMEVGGIAVESKKIGRKEYVNTESGTITNTEFLEKLFKEYIPEGSRQREVAVKLQGFMSSVGAEWGNEISFKRFGIKDFNNARYFPIETVDGTSNQSTDTGINSRSTSGGLYDLLNWGALKQRNPNADNRLMVRNVFDVFANHMSNMAKYNAYALVLLDTRKWLGYKTKTNAGDERNPNAVVSVETTALIKDKYGESYKTYIENFIKDMTGVRRSQENRGAEWIKNQMAKYKVAVIAANLRVIWQQPFSYIRAMAVLEAKYMRKGIKDTPQKRRAYEAMEKYSYLRIYQKHGYHTVNSTKNFADKIKHADTFGERSAEKLMKGVEVVDHFTWGEIWLACEEKIKDTRHALVPETDEFYRAVAEEFNTVICATQVIDTPLTKSQFMRSDNYANALFGSFMGEPTLTYNLLLEAYHEIRDAWQRGEKDIFKKHGRRVARLLGVYVLTCVANYIATSLYDAVKVLSEDEDEEFIDAFLEEWWVDLLKELDPLRKIPMVKEIVSILSDTIFNGFHYSSPSMEFAAVENLGKNIRTLHKYITGDASLLKLTEETLMTASTFSGLPLAKVWDQVKMIWNLIVRGYDDSLMIK